MTRFCTSVKRFLGTFCKEAQDNGRRCIVCALLAGICSGAATAFAADPCDQQQSDATVTKVIKMPVTFIGEKIFGFFGLKSPCPQSTMLRVANVADVSMQQRLAGNPYAKDRLSHTHQYW